MTTLACKVSQKSLTKHFITQNMERKKIGQIYGRISRGRLVRNPTIQYIIMNLLTKYDNSSLHSFTEIFDEKFHFSKYGKKENRTNTGKNKQGNAGSQYHDKIHYYQLADQIRQSSLHSFTEIFDKNFIIQNMERKKIGQIQGRLSRRRLVCNPTIQYIIINLQTKYD